MNKFLGKDATGNWNTIPPVPAEKSKNVNCHKFVLYIIGRMSWDEMVLDLQDQKEAGLDFTFGEKVRNISNIPFIHVKDAKSLYLLADKSCEIGRDYIGQILDAQTGETAHSFIVRRALDGAYTCFDKQGFKYPFTVHDLSTTLDFINKDGEKSYENQKWRFVPIKIEE